MIFNIPLEDYESPNLENHKELEEIGESQELGGSAND